MTTEEKSLWKRINLVTKLWKDEIKESTRIKEKLWDEICESAEKIVELEDKLQSLKRGNHDNGK